LVELRLLREDGESIGEPHRLGLLQLSVLKSNRENRKRSLIKVERYFMMEKIYFKGKKFQGVRKTKIKFPQKFGYCNKL